MAIEKEYQRMNKQFPFGHRLIIDWKKEVFSTPYLHKYGGVPTNGAKLPNCHGCGNRFHLLFQIDLADPSMNYLGIDNLDFLFFFSCLNCATYENTMYYTQGNRGKKIVILQEKPGKFVKEYPAILDEHPVVYRILEEDDYPLTEDTLSLLLSQEGKHQLGGMATWIQHVEQVPCNKCGNTMSNLAMIDSELYIGNDGFREKGHMFGDEGILYIFYCRECGVFATRAQSL